MSTRPSPIIKAALALVAGALLSVVLYPLTHGSTKRIPELYGIGAGCMLADLVMFWMFGDYEAVQQAFTAQALVGLGVAANRALLTLAEQ